MSGIEELNEVANLEYGLDYCFLTSDQQESCNEEVIYDRKKWGFDIED